MSFKEYIKKVEARLDEKPSWGNKEVKSLLKDVLIEIYEGQADEETRRKDQASNKSVSVSDEHAIIRDSPESLR